MPARRSRSRPQLLRRDGQRYDLELRGVPIQHRGQPHVLYIGRDITQAKRAERALRDSEEQYRAIFNASADALVLRDADYRAVEVNPAYTTMSGYTREEVMAADHVLTQADPAVRARHRAQHELALAGQELRFEVTATRKDGSTMQGEVRGTPHDVPRPARMCCMPCVTSPSATPPNSAAASWSGSCARRRRWRRSASSPAASRTTSTTSSPACSAISPWRRSAALPGEDPVLARQLGQARLAGRAGPRPCGATAGVLASAARRKAAARAGAGGSAGAATAAPEPAFLDRGRVRRGVSAEREPAVPPVVADPVQLEQVLFNLCINARDAIHDHGTIRVRIGYSAAAGHCASCSAPLEGTRWVWVEVADDGSGMPREVMERMFEPFFTTKEVGRGTGMGLAMVHGIVHDHGGHIQVESTPGEGSVFRVLLPAAAQDTRRADAPAAPAPAARRRRRAASGAGAAGRRRGHRQRFHGETC